MPVARAREVQRVNVDFPIDLLRAIDREARRIGQILFSADVTLLT